MNTQQAIKQIINAHHYFEQQSTGYKSWGKVEVLQIALRLDNDDILISNSSKKIHVLTESDIEINPQKNTIFRQLFSSRKNVNAILITRQEYASQVKEEIPPILDDQAQLLGVSIRIAKNENQIQKSLCGRYATILPDSTSICLGSGMEDAYVAAQLLEKTSKAFVEAAYLGGAKSINRIEAWLMHKFYMLKYSKEAQKNK